MKRLKLIWLRIKYLLFVKQPVPLFNRRVCIDCGFISSKSLYSSCPLCGYGHNTVYIVVNDQNEILGVYHSKKSAEKDISYIRSACGDTLNIECFRFND